ncbi:MAG: IS4 family transposase [Planctomycetes bacterium]|nr:IS4 family transposase [Planctomycetota bacterium]
MRPAKHQYTILKQICQHIPAHLVPKLARSFGVDKKARSFSPWSHVVAMLHVQIAHSLSLNDVADTLRNHSGVLTTMQLNLQTFLPQFAIVKEASTADSTEAYRLCLNLKSGEIAVFDKAYVDFTHLADLDRRGVFWITRAKDNMQYRIVKQHTKPKGDILSDVLIELKTPKSCKAYPQRLRLITANVEVDGVKKTMTFITNNMSWAPSSICDLYKCRWGVEVFFKQIKQTLQLADFLGHSTWFTTHDRKPSAGLFAGF